MSEQDKVLFNLFIEATKLHGATVVLLASTAQKSTPENISALVTTIAQNIVVGQTILAKLGFNEEGAQNLINSTADNFIKARPDLFQQTQN